MFYSIEELRPGESPHLFAKEHYKQYRYKNKSLDKSFIETEAASYAKRNKKAAILVNYEGEYYLFVKE